MAAADVMRQVQQLQALQQFAAASAAGKQQQQLAQASAPPSKPGQRSHVAAQRALNNSGRAAQAPLSHAASPGDALVKGVHRHHHDSDDDDDDGADESGSDNDGDGEVFHPAIPLANPMPIMEGQAPVGSDDSDDDDESDSDDDDDGDDMQSSMAAPAQAPVAATTPTAGAPTEPMTETRAAEAGDHHHHHSRHNVTVIGTIRCPRNAGEARHFHKQDVHDGDYMTMTLANNLLVIGGGSNDGAAQLLRDGTFYVEKAHIKKLNNQTDQIFEVGLTIGSSSGTCCTVLQNDCLYDETIHHMPLNAEMKAQIDLIGIRDAEEISRHVTVVHDRAIMKRTGDAERAANLVKQIYKNLFEVALGDDSAETMSLLRKELDDVIAAFNTWKASVSFPVSHSQFGVKVHRRSLYERADLSPAERWISDLDHSHANSLSFIMELTVVPGTIGDEIAVVASTPATAAK